jgi:hypothetical protein
MPQARFGDNYLELVLLYDKFCDLIQQDDVLEEHI